MFIFDRCHRSSDTVTPAKYECDAKNLKGTFVISEILLTEKLTNGTLLTPTPVSCEGDMIFLVINHIDIANQFQAELYDKSILALLQTPKLPSVECRMYHFLLNTAPNVILHTLYQTLYILHSTKYVRSIVYEFVQVTYIVFQNSYLIIIYCKFILIFSCSVRVIPRWLPLMNDYQYISTVEI